ACRRPRTKLVSRCRGGLKMRLDLAETALFRQGRPCFTESHPELGATAMQPQFLAETHQVTNQVPPLEGTNLYRLDVPLQEWVHRYGGGWTESRLDAYGALAGGPLMAAGFLANENKPQFRSHDRYGNRIDQVDFHPAYHQLMQTAVEHGIPSLPWTHPQA